MYLIKDAFAMIADLRQHAPGIGRWGGLLNIPQIVGGLFFLPRVDAALILAACIGSVVVAAQMHKRTPFTRLTSIVHVVWVPLFPYLLTVVMAHGVSDAFGVWLACVVVTMGVSLVLDVWNLVLYAFSRNRQFEVSAP